MTLDMPALPLPCEPGLSSRLQKRMCNSSASCDRRAGGRGSFKLLARFLSDIFGLVAEFWTTSDVALSSLSVPASANGVRPSGMPRPEVATLSERPTKRPWGGFRFSVDQ